MTHPVFDLPRLRAGVKPFRLHYFPRLRSTNDHAAALRKANKLFAPAIILTANQTAGRGRGQNTWFSNADILTVTFALPIEDHLAPHQLPLVAGLAVRNAVAQLLGNNGDVLLKWPNDILVHGRKLAGLLCERIHRIDLVGLGLNVNLSLSAAPKPLRDRITSLKSLAHRSFDMTDTLIAIATELHRMTSRRAEHPFASLLAEYDRHHALLGQEITVTFSPTEPPLCGRCEGLDEIGRLLLRGLKTHHLHPIIAGHVELANYGASSEIR